MFNFEPKNIFDLDFKSSLKLINFNTFNISNKDSSINKKFNLFNANNSDKFMTSY